MLKKRISYFMVLVLILCFAVSPILASEDYIAPLYCEDQIGWNKVLGPDKVRVIFEVDMDMERATDQVDSAIKEAAGENLYVFQGKGMEQYREATISTNSLEAFRKNRNIKSITIVPKSEPLAQTIPINIDKAFDLFLGKTNYCSGYTGEGIKVAVIDSGIDIDHPDLVLAGGIDMTSGNTDLSYLDESDPTAYAYGHGTHVSGIIAAQDNDIGVVGVAPEVELYMVRLWSPWGYTSVAACLDWCTANDMDIVNMSLYTTVYPALVKALTDASNAGITLVAAAGNSYPNPITFPASDSHVIAVGSVNQNNIRAATSCTGSELDVCAQGVSVYSTYPGGIYSYMSGTSMASPNVVGVLALLKEEFPSKTPAQLEALLKANALDLGATGRDDEYGYGLARVQASTDSFEASAVGSVPYGWTNEDDTGGTTTTIDTWSTHGSKALFLHTDSVIGGYMLLASATKTFDFTGMSTLSLDYSFFRDVINAPDVYYVVNIYDSSGASILPSTIIGGVEDTWTSGTPTITLPTGTTGSHTIKLMVVAAFGEDIDGELACKVDNLRLNP